MRKRYPICYPNIIIDGKERTEDAMEKDMKKQIAEASRELLFEDQVKKLTVKAIVDKCKITRQAFYYHFEDIPDLLKWILDQASSQLEKEIFEQEDEETVLKRCFLIALESKPYMDKTMQTNYGQELEKMLRDHIYHLSMRIVEKKNLYQDCSYRDLKLVVRYHCEAITGILRNWTDEDSENLDHIVHEINLLMGGKIIP